MGETAKRDPKKEPPKDTGKKADEKGEKPRRHIPAHILGGRVRTTTLALCLLWLGLWFLYLFLNQPEDSTPPPADAVVISSTPYVPLVPETATPTETPYTTTDTPVPTTTVAPTGSPTPGSPQDTTGPGSSESTTGTSTTTTDRPFPFELPHIPGLTDNRNSDTPDGTGERAP
ncbi:hypothetical protein OED52_13915 [Rhodococcus sp. Z13]|uniref:Uncharacterized protein n=1 Tax=Rhodococcus sacchari TaxID=2962047 RepID=A0ACD4DCI6_9NOCA|nr:hypothetical protein [Rhodococcus sp. Z13]UYP17768.1 hypothetical protein OED52_13915 [Rhodococcus sp. Z13]